MALTAEQRNVLSTILKVGGRLGASPKALKAAVEAGLVESGLRNLNYGDRDSLGVFQQRPSQGWGSPGQVRDVEHAATQFFSRAIPQAGKYGNAGELAQAVQRSAYPGRYNQQSGQAASLLQGMGSDAGALVPTQGAGTKTTTTPGVDNSDARRQALGAFLLGGTDPATGQQTSGDILQLALQMRALKDTPAVTKQVSRGAAATPGVTTSHMARGTVAVAAGANRPGAKLSPEILRFVEDVAGKAGRKLGIGTGTNHNRLTVDGNVSDHWDGHAADLPMAVDSKQGDMVAAHALQAAGVPWSQAARMAQQGGLWTLHPASGEWKGKRVQVIWKTNQGGNHHNHVHIGVR